ADGLLELLDLGADRLRRQVKHSARTGDAALAGDGPEIEQVVVIQVAHARNYTMCRRIAGVERSTFRRRPGLDLHLGRPISSLGNISKQSFSRVVPFQIIEWSAPQASAGRPSTTRNPSGTVAATDDVDTPDDA